VVVAMMTITKLVINSEGDEDVVDGWGASYIHTQGDDV